MASYALSPLDVVPDIQPFGVLRIGCRVKLFDVIFEVVSAREPLGVPVAGNFRALKRTLVGINMSSITVISDSLECFTSRKVTYLYAVFAPLPTNTLFLWSHPAIVQRNSAELSSAVFDWSGNAESSS
jgi:hypothetical protein